MRWIGQHIWDLISRFRNDVYLEDLSTTAETNVLVVDSDGKVSKSTTLARDIESDIETSIDTLPGLISFGAVGATTDIVAGDLTMYNAVNDGNPTISLGSSATNRLEIKSTYNSGTQTLCDIDFTTYTDSGTTNDGRYNFFVDEVAKLVINDTTMVAYADITALDDGARISVQNTTATSATEGGKLRLMADDGAAMADNHRLGVIEFHGAEDASGTDTIGARIEAMCDAAWSASENGGRLDFYTTAGNAVESKVLTLNSDKLATFTGAVTVTGALTGTLATASQTNITGVGTITTGVWNGTAIANAYLDADTAHLTTDQTFTGSKTMGTDVKLNFRDANSYINSPTANDLEVVATDIVLDASNTIALEADAGVVITGDLSVSGDTIKFESANADDPIVTIKNTSNAANDMASLKFVKDRGAAPAIGDNLAEIYFIGEDADQNSQEYGRILCETDVVTGGQESGVLKFGVANHDGGNGYGLTLTGGSEDAEVDVTVGLGANSVVTVPGVLDAQKLRPTGQIVLMRAGFKDDIGTTKHYVPLQSELEQTNSYHEMNSFVAPYPGKLLKVMYRGSGNYSGGEFTFTLEQIKRNESFLATPTVLETIAIDGPTNGTTDPNMVTANFVGGSGTNAFVAGDMVLLGIQSDTDVTGSNSKHFVTLVFEFDFSGLA